MEEISRFNGNGKRYKTNIPLIFYITDYINPVAIQHIKKNTGLLFKKGSWGYSVQPKNSKQIIKLLVTYDFKTNYVNNWNSKNTLFLKGLYNVGFKVDCICFDCCKKNGIYTNGLKKKEYLSC